MQQRSTIRSGKFTSNSLPQFISAKELLNLFTQEYLMNAEMPITHPSHLCTLIDPESIIPPHRASALLPLQTRRKQQLQSAPGSTTWMAKSCMRNRQDPGPKAPWRRRRRRRLSHQSILEHPSPIIWRCGGISHLQGPAHQPCPVRRVEASNLT